MKSGHRGAAMLEFLLAGVLVLLPATFAILEFAQLTAARNALNFAAFEAARAGAVSGASVPVMRGALVRGLVPLFAPLQVGARNAAEGDASAAIARAWLEVNRPDLTRLDIENPRQPAVEDFGVIEQGRRVIPNDGIEFRNPIGASSGQTLRDANVLAVRIRYCRPLVMPFVSRMIPALLRPTTTDLFELGCLARGRLPLESRAIAHMQSAFDAANLAGGIE
jgi:hypothetical protein